MQNQWHVNWLKQCTRNIVSLCQCHFTGHIIVRLLTVGAVRIDARIRYLCQMNRINREKREKKKNVLTNLYYILYVSYRKNLNVNRTNATSCTASINVNVPRVRYNHAPSDEKKTNRMKQKRNFDVLVIGYIFKKTFFLSFRFIFYFFFIVDVMKTMFTNLVFLPCRLPPFVKIPHYDFYRKWLSSTTHHMCADRIHSNLCIFVSLMGNMFVRSSSNIENDKNLVFFSLLLNSFICRYANRLRGAHIHTYSTYVKFTVQFHLLWLLFLFFPLFRCCLFVDFSIM